MHSKPALRWPFCTSGAEHLTPRKTLGTPCSDLINIHSTANKGLTTRLDGAQSAFHTRLWRTPIKTISWLAPRHAMALSIVRLLMDIPETERMPSGEINDLLHTAQRYAEPVMQQLVRANILDGLRGPAGGYILHEQNRHLSVGAVIRAIAGTDRPDDAVKHVGFAMLRIFDDIPVRDLPAFSTRLHGSDRMRPVPS